ncbi:hypothetical protein ACLOJK_037197 [Asimina triloba]
MARTGATSSVPTSSSKGKRKVVDPPSLIQKRIRPCRLLSSVEIDDRPVNIDSLSSSSSSGYLPSPSSPPERVSSGKPPRWVKKGASSYEPSVPPADVNVEDFLVELDDNLGGERPHSGKTDDTKDVMTAGHSESTQPASPGGVLFSTPSTTTSQPTMSSTSMPSSSQFQGVTGSSGPIKILVINFRLTRISSLKFLR